MHRGDHDVQLRQQLRGLVQGAVGQDVALDAGQQVRPRSGGIERLDHGKLVAQPLGGQPVGYRQAWRVIGDRQVFVAQFRCGHSHILDGAAAVGPRGVCVQIAALRRHQVGTGHRALRRLCLQSGQILRHLAAGGLGDDGRGGVADAFQRGQCPGADPPIQFAWIEPSDNICRTPERRHPVGRGEVCLQQVGDAPQRRHRLCTGAAG